MQSPTLCGAADLRIELKRFACPQCRPVRISVIVPAFNEEKLVGETLRRVQNAASVLAERGWECEWIVCDNNSTDRTAELARGAGAKVVFEPVNQIARARNTGAAAATGDWLIFVDADSHPSPELFEEVAEQIQGGRCLAGGCTLRMEVSGRWAWLGLHFWNWVSRTMRWFAGSFIFCEAGVFRRVGGFNQELYASEEIDLSKRLCALARQTGKEIVILHRHPIVTSPRKLHLYSRRDYLRFFGRAILTGRGWQKHRKHCGLWYDGRR